MWSITGQPNLEEKKNCTTVYETLIATCTPNPASCTGDGET